MDFEGHVRLFAQLALYSVALKALIGWHWPWEVCKCCGKKYKDHKGDENENQEKVL